MVWGGIKQAAKPLEQQMKRIDTAASELGGQAGSMQTTLSDIQI